MKNLSKYVASFFGIGFLPVGPGTWGSAAGAVIAWYSGDALLTISILFMAAGFWAATKAEQDFGSKDPGAFVLDEVCGMMLTVLLLPRVLWLYGAAFVLFRLLDIWKPWPISKIQACSKSWSIMGDDLAAGILANIILRGILMATGKL